MAPSIITNLTTEDVIALTDASGQIVVKYDYDTWGNVTVVEGDTDPLASLNPYTYVGKFAVRYDRDTGMYLMTWRDYDPTTGRFIIPDTYLGEEDKPFSQNRYLYAEGDPVNNIDPSGHWVVVVVRVGVTVVKVGTKVIPKGIKLVRTYTGKNSVYISKVADGTVQYVGITNNIARRQAEHLASKGIQIRELMRNLSRSDARAVEQTLIEIYGLGKNGGSLINKINSISRTNPNYSKQLERGYELLKSIGY